MKGYGDLKGTKDTDMKGAGPVGDPVDWEHDLHP